MMQLAPLRSPAWGKVSMRALRNMEKRYGPPQEKTEHFAVWYFNGPWKRTVVYREVVPHHFPHPHEDVLSQTVDYPVPMEKVRELSEFDGSLVVDRTKGELTAHCNSEEMNRALLNLAHDIIIGKLTPLGARETLRSIHNALRLNWPEDYAVALNFSKLDPVYEARDPDHASP